MWQFMLQFYAPIIIMAIALFLLVGLMWLSNHGIDKLKHPEEYKTKGQAGERIFYKLLTEKIGVPENQIFPLSITTSRTFTFGPMFRF